MSFINIKLGKLVPCLFAVTLAVGSGCGAADLQRDLLLGVGGVALEFLFPDAPPPSGPAGQSCWDLNGNGEKDYEPSTPRFCHFTPDAVACQDGFTEDTNGDGEIDVLDCRVMISPVPYSRHSTCGFQADIVQCGIERRAARLFRK